MTHPVVRIALATALLVASFSMYAPVLAVMLQQRGHGTAAIGAFAMIGFSCIALLIPVMPRILAHFGELQACRTGAAMNFVATTAFASFDNLAVWCLFAVLGGSGSAAVWNATEALIARHSPPGQRGRITGLYQSALGAAMALGPFAPAVFHMSGPQTLVVAALVQGLGLATLWTIRGAMPAAPGSHPQGLGPDANELALSTWGALKAVPALALIAFAGGVFEGGLSAVSAANGAALGLSMPQAVSIVGVLGVGSFLFQLPAGLLADRALPSRVFAAAGTLLLMSSVSLAFSGAAPWLLWGCAFVWGGVGGALYTLTMIRVAHQFKGQATAAGTAAMITGYTLGGATGPLMSGAALQGWGAPGMALWLALLSGMVVYFAARVPPDSAALSS